MSPPDRPQHLSLAGLKDRGWTPALIQRFLGEPDETAPNPHYRTAAPMRLYLVSRVEACEQTEAWQTARATTQQRQQRAVAVAAGQREAVLARVAALTIAVQDVEPDALTHAACRHYNRRQEDWEEGRHDRGQFDNQPRLPASPDSDPAFLARITVNYLRHQGTSYERQLEQLFGKVGADAGRARVKKRVLEAIAEAYPHLASECARQRVRMDAESA